MTLPRPPPPARAASDEAWLDAADDIRRRRDVLVAETVNGRRVETAELIDGDRVQIPGLEVQVREESEDRAALPALRVA